MVCLGHVFAHMHGIMAVLIFPHEQNIYLAASTFLSSFVSLNIFKLLNSLINPSLPNIWHFCFVTVSLKQTSEVIIS